MKTDAKMLREMADCDNERLTSVEKTLCVRGANALEKVKKLKALLAALGCGDKQMLRELPGLVREMRKDRERLKFMIETGGNLGRGETGQYVYEMPDYEGETVFFWADTPDDAIDAAMEAGK